MNPPCPKGLMKANCLNLVSVLLGASVLVCSCTTSPKAKEITPAVTIDEIAAGIEKHIAERSKLSGGSFQLRYKNKELNLQLVRVHLEDLCYLGEGVSFACVDLVGSDGPVYDVDFFMRGPADELTVTETTVHKINGQPLYLWEQRRDGSWRRVPVKNAPRRLLGVINGSDEFEFTYRVKLPQIAGEAHLWLPLAESDTFQRVQVKDIKAPQPWRGMGEREQGNKRGFLKTGPTESGKDIEIR